MPRFEPFRGLRYAPRVVALDDVISPPYDVIGPEERDRLAARNPANAVLVELPQPDSRSGLDRYQVAARLFTRWQETGILRPDPSPALYPYRMTSAGGRQTTGVLGALGLAEPGQESDILPHEQTMPKPRSDRLDLLRATRANLSPIWGLSMARGLSALLAPDSPAAAAAVDDDGVRHELWVLDDPLAIAAVGEAVAKAPVVVADGHHRYETALAYQREQRVAAGGGGPYDAVLALVVELSEEQVGVGAIHRAISGLPPGTDLNGAFGTWCTVVRAGPADQRTVAALDESGSMALVTPGGAWLLLPTAEAAEAAGSDLDSSLVELVLASLPPHELSHPHSRAEAVGAVTTGAAQAAVLLRPPTVDQIAEWAGGRRRMPPKTSYFSPKPRTGMVFRSLEE